MSRQARRLTHARLIRRKIAATMNLLKIGQITLQDTLRSPQEHLEHVPVHVLLEHTPKLGVAGTKKVLKTAKVWPTDCVGTLTPDDVERIIAHLPPRVRDATMNE